MDTFWGCAPRQLLLLADRLARAADRLEELLEQIVVVAETAAWTGADADAHRARVRRTADAGADLAAAVRRLGVRLRHEAEEQEEASAPDRGADADPFEMLRAGLPRPGSLLELMRRIEDQVVDILLPPGTLRRRAADGVMSPELRPWLVGPLHRPLGLGTATASRAPSPPAAPLEPGTASQAWAEATRKKLARSNPFTKTAQTLMSVHSALDTGHTALEDRAAGHEWAEAAVAAVGVPVHLSGTVLGARSPLGQVQDGVEGFLASKHQAVEDLRAAAAERDPAAALRAAERDAYRSAEAIGTVVLSSPAPGLVGAVEDLGAASAELLDPVAPEAAETVRSGFDGARTRAETLSERLGLTDPVESLYGMRRRHLPMPWDEAA